jgi:hypothetical protein
VVVVESPTTWSLGLADLCLSFSVLSRFRAYLQILRRPSAHFAQRSAIALRANRKTSRAAMCVRWAALPFRVIDSVHFSLALIFAFISECRNSTPSRFKSLSTMGP